MWRKKSIVGGTNEGKIKPLVFIIFNVILYVIELWFNDKEAVSEVPPWGWVWRLHESNLGQTMISSTNTLQEPCPYCFQLLALNNSQVHLKSKATKMQKRLNQERKLHT
jgi:hypothetical protein